MDPGPTTGRAWKSRGNLFHDRFGSLTKNRESENHPLNLTEELHIHWLTPALMYILQGDARTRRGIDLMENLFP